VFSGTLIESNTAQHKGGGVFLREGVFNSTDAGWGSTDGDNSPDDVAIRDGRTYSDYGDAESFWCSYGTGYCL